MHNLRKSTQFTHSMRDFTLKLLGFLHSKRDFTLKLLGFLHIQLNSNKYDPNY